MKTQKNPITVKKLYENRPNGIKGYFLSYEGNSFETGTAFGGNTPYSQHDPDKAKWIMFTEDEGIAYSHIEDKHGPWSVENADEYRKYTCTAVDGYDEESYSW
jgi:hypothetical protein